ncbi:20692_t:CDS:2, partial [Cetraspora pellucida]
MFKESNHTEYTNEIENTSLLTSFEKGISSDLFSTKLTTKTLENDTTSMSNWLDSQKEHDSQWIVVRSWDKDDTLTNIVLSMFVGFNHNRHNILLVQALLPNKSMEFHVWMFKEILKATDKQPAVIITDADFTVDSAVCQ